MLKTITNCKTYIEKNFLKVRNIYMLDSINKEVNLPLGYNYKCFLYCDREQILNYYNIEIIEEYKQRYGKFYSMIIIKKNQDYCGHFVAINNFGNKSIYHDSIEIKSKQSILVNGNVAESYRGKKLFPFMIKTLFAFLKTNTTQSKIIDIVECKNISSKKSHEFLNCKSNKNFLIKFFGKNIFSIYDGNLHILPPKNKY